MKAIRIHSFGGPEKLALDEIDIPEPGNDEVLVKVHATAVNPVDIKIREGEAKEKFPVTLPLTLGWDLAGEVEKTGAGVTGFKKGDEIYGRPDVQKNGAYADFIVVKANQLSFKPQKLSWEESAAIPLAGLTAWQGLFDHGHLEKGQKVLIHAASGGVGSFAVQFAKWKGAYVAGTSSKENIPFLQSLGADEVIDYKAEKFEDRLHDFDLVLDTLGAEVQKRSLAVLKEGGTLITTVKPEYQQAAAEKKIRLEGYTAQSWPEHLKQIATLADERIIRPVIAAVMPLERAAEAQEMNAQNHTRGKIVLKVT